MRIAIIGEEIVGSRRIAARRRIAIDTPHSPPARQVEGTGNDCLSIWPGALSPAEMEENPPFPVYGNGSHVCKHDRLLVAAVNYLSI